MRSFDLTLPAIDLNWGSSLTVSSFVVASTEEVARQVVRPGLELSEVMSSLLSMREHCLGV